MAKYRTHFEIRELLGRLHEQKNWFEPDNYVQRG